jgi:hypothetical protein
MNTPRKNTRATVYSLALSVLEHRDEKKLSWVSTGGGLRKVDADTGCAKRSPAAVSFRNSTGRTAPAIRWH